jgi:hypothetical protein
MLIGILVVFVLAAVRTAATSNGFDVLHLQCVTCMDRSFCLVLCVARLNTCMSVFCGKGGKISICWSSDTECYQSGRPGSASWSFLDF